MAGSTAHVLPSQCSAAPSVLTATQSEAPAHDTPAKPTSLLLTVGVDMTCHGVVDADAPTSPNINKVAVLTATMLFRMALLGENCFFGTTSSTTSPTSRAGDGTSFALHGVTVAVCDGRAARFLNLL
jgi:hypothetical protein